MVGFLTILLGILMLAVLAVLATGMIGMARGQDPHRSNKLMRWRVLLQGAALLTFMLLLAVRH
jgi:hypothetical protein